MRRLAPSAVPPAPKPVGRRLLPDPEEAPEVPTGRRALGAPEAGHEPTQILDSVDVPPPPPPAPRVWQRDVDIPPPPPASTAWQREADVPPPPTGRWQPEAQPPPMAPPSAWYPQADPPAAPTPEAETDAYHGLFDDRPYGRATAPYFSDRESAESDLDVEQYSAPEHVEADDEVTVIEAPPPSRGRGARSARSVVDDEAQPVEPPASPGPWSRGQAIIAALGLILLVAGAGMTFTGVAALVSPKAGAPITLGELITMGGWCLFAIATAIWHTTTHRLANEFEPKTVAIFAGIVLVLVAVGLPFPNVLVTVPAWMAFAAGGACLLGSAAVALIVRVMGRRHQRPTSGSRPRVEEPVDDGAPRRGIA